MRLKYDDESIVPFVPYQRVQRTPSRHIVLDQYFRIVYEMAHRHGMKLVVT